MPLLWQYLMDADDADDLSTPEAGRAWMVWQEWVPLHGDDADGRFWSALPAWSADEREEWTRCVLALRSLVGRLTDRRPKRDAARDGFGAWQADAVLNRYLFKLRWTTRKGPAGGPALDRKNFLGLQGWPTEEVRIAGQVERRTVGPFFSRMEVPGIFWQWVFYSLVAPDVDPVCADCGRPLERTKKGHRPRKERCRRCYLRQLHDGEDPAERRKKWAAEKRRQRERERPQR
jgi:hypothetical protein